MWLLQLAVAVEVCAPLEAQLKFLATEKRAVEARFAGLVLEKHQLELRVTELLAETRPLRARNAGLDAVVATAAPDLSDAVAVAPRRSGCRRQLLA